MREPDLPIQFAHAPGSPLRRRVRSFLVAVTSAALSSGCLSEQSFPMQSHDVKRIPQLTPAPGRYRTVREWLVYADTQLKSLRPLSLAKPLLTDDMVASGKPIDVFRHFGINPGGLQTLATNYPGIAYTARLVSMTSNIDAPAPAWPGFEDVWIPVAPEVSLAARLGFSKKDGRIINAPCIVILPGFYGDIGVQRSRDLALALIDSGFHALAIDLRGHGQTEHKYPNVPYTFGVRESGDLLAVSEWLQTRPQIISTGLIGYCWGAHTALLTAWDDARCDIDPSVSPLIAPPLRTHTNKHHFSAGVMALSPVLKWDEMLDWMDVEHDALIKPMYSGIQDTIRARKARKGYQPQNGNLRELFAAEMKRTPFLTSLQMDDIYTLLRLMPYKNKGVIDKMDRVRVPVLIVHAADDPAIPAQWTADFAAQTKNTNVASLILPSGGHVGFAAWARSYYFSLIVNFFDPARGAAHATYARYEIREFGPNDPRPAINACPPPVQRASASP